MPIKKKLRSSPFRWKRARSGNLPQSNMSEIFQLSKVQFRTASTVLLISRWERTRKMLQRANQQDTHRLDKLFRQHDFNNPKMFLRLLPFVKMKTEACLKSPKVRQRLEWGEGLSMEACRDTRTNRPHVSCRWRSRFIFVLLLLSGDNLRSNQGSTLRLCK